MRAEGVPFVRVIARAYGVPEYRVFGPDWIQTQRYAITAFVSDPQEFQPLLRQELAKRFQLAARWESRELPVYTLKQIDGVAPKLRAPDSGARGGSASTEGTLNLPNSNIKQFINMLSDFVQCPVFDETDLPGRFDFSLTWAPRRGALESAVKDQLGLLLVDGKKSMDVLVIDHVEKLVLPETKP
jgi:uncharacterized protein (TIGR03435 family)